MEISLRSLLVSCANTLTDVSVLICECVCAGVCVQVCVCVL